MQHHRGHGGVGPPLGVDEVFDGLGVAAHDDPPGRGAGCAAFPFAFLGVGGGRTAEEADVEPVLVCCAADAGDLRCGGGEDAGEGLARREDAVERAVDRGGVGRCDAPCVVVGARVGFGLGVGVGVGGRLWLGVSEEDGLGGLGGDDGGRDGGRRGAGRCNLRCRVRVGGAREGRVDPVGIASVPVPVRGYHADELVRFGTGDAGCTRGRARRWACLCVGARTRVCRADDGAVLPRVAGHGRAAGMAVGFLSSWGHGRARGVLREFR